MLYRENGQFKTSYRADQQIFPHCQDRIAIISSSRWRLPGGACVCQRLHLPRHPDSLCHHGAGRPGGEHPGGLLRQISLGSGAFAGRGAYGPTTPCAHPGMPLIPGLSWRASCHLRHGVRLPSLRG